MIDIKKLTIEKAHADLSSGVYTVRELVEAYLLEIEKKNTDINAYLEIYREDALRQADEAQEMFKNGTATTLTGIPLGMKDNILIQGKQATAGSKALAGHIAVTDSTVTENLRKQGAIFLGRTNMDEFAMGSSTETSAYGITKNPLDVTRVPGGSSGGSAAAVAMDGCVAALGSETCGSVRQPAAFCGLVGFKPTYGAVSRSGLIAMGNSLDQVGPLTKTVSDSEILYKALASYDPKDATSIPLDERKKAPHTKTKKIGVPMECMDGEGIDSEIHEAFLKSLEYFKKIGYEIVPIEMRLIQYSLAVYYIVMPAEVSTNLGRIDGIRYGHHAEGKTLFDLYAKTRGTGFGREARRRILLGTYVLSHGYYNSYYRKAILLRNEITRSIDKIFKDVDFIVTPTTPMVPFKFGEKILDPVAMYLSDVFAAPANLSGCPAIALPSGKMASGLPASIQITAPRWADDELFVLGKAFESVLQ